MFVFLASPFTHRSKITEHARARAAHIVVGLYCHQHDYTVYSPIGHFFKPALLMSLPGDAEAWRRRSEDMIRAAYCMDVLQLEGWRESTGIQTIELPIAHETRTPVRYVRPDWDGELLFSPRPFEQDTSLNDFNRMYENIKHRYASEGVPLLEETIA